MSREVDNGPLVGTVPASAVILDSQPAELQGNELLLKLPACGDPLWQRGKPGLQGDQSAQWLSQGTSPCTWMLMSTRRNLSCQLTAHWSVSDGGEETLIPISLSQPWASEWIWKIFSQLSGCYFYSSSRDVQWQWQTAGVTSVATT